MFCAAEGAVKFGVFFLMQCPEGKSHAEVYRETLEQVDAAEQLGFDAVWLTEHHFIDHAHDHWLLGGAYGICSSPLAFGCAIAQRTKRIRIGQAINVLPLHYPIRIAEDAAVLDIVSEGRLDFGAGLGYRSYQFTGYGVPEPEKIGRFHESLEIIVKAWTSEAFSYEGQYYKIPPIELVPRPIQKPHPPIWVAPTRFWNDEAIDFAAKNGYQILLAWASPEQLRAGRARYEQAWRAAGHSHPMHFPVTRHAFVGATDAEAYQVAEPAVQYYYRHTAPTRPVHDYERDAWIFGSPGTCVRKLADLAAVGVDYVLLWFAYGTLAHRDVLRSMERFAAQVMPEARALAAG